MRDFTGKMLQFARPHLLQGGVKGCMARTLAWKAAEWNLMTLAIMLRAPKDRELVG